MNINDLNTWEQLEHFLTGNQGVFHAYTVIELLGFQRLSSYKFFGLIE